MSQLVSFDYNFESELIFIDENINIAKLSSDGKVTKFITITSEECPQCVYWSPSTKNLLIGMNKYDRESDKENLGKVTRYNHIGQLTQTIPHSDVSHTRFQCPRYITENNNEDVSDCDSVVVTSSEGTYRFSYTGPASNSMFVPGGICTDAFSNILVCDSFTNSVQILNKDGQFLSVLLTNQSPGIQGTPSVISYDLNSHLLWVISFDNNIVQVYRYINRNLALYGTHIS